MERKTITIVGGMTMFIVGLAIALTLFKEAPVPPAIDAKKPVALEYIVYVARAPGEEAVSKGELSQILQKTKDIYEKHGIKLEFERFQKKDIAPETWCMSPECRYNRRLAWQSELKNRTEPLKLVVLPPLKNGALYSSAGVADGVCTRGMVMVNLKKGEFDGGTATIAHELAHLLGAVHRKDSLMSVSSGAYLENNQRKQHFNFLPETIEEMFKCGLK